MQVPSLGQEDPLQTEMAAYFNSLPWRSPWTEKPGGLKPMGSQRVGHGWATDTCCTPETSIMLYVSFISIKNIIKLSANIALCVQWYLQQLVSPLPFSSSGVFTENLFLDGPVGSPAPCFISTPHPGVHVCAQLLHSCPALCDPVDCSPASSSVHGIL